MNRDTIKDHWTESSGKVGEQWGKLTDSHLDTIAGQRDQLAGKTLEVHGISRDEAAEEIRHFDNRTH